LTQFSSISIQLAPIYFQRAKAADLIFLVNLLRYPGQNFTQKFQYFIIFLSSK